MRSNPDIRPLSCDWAEITLRVPEWKVKSVSRLLQRCLSDLEPPSIEVVLATLRDDVSLCTNFRLLQLTIFGSVATGVATPCSDIDIYAEYQEPPGLRHFELKERLERLLKWPVDLTTLPSLYERFIDPADQDRIIKDSIHVWQR